MPIALRSPAAWLEDDLQCAVFVQEIVRSLGLRDFSLRFLRCALPWNTSAVASVSLESREATVGVHEGTWPLTSLSFKHQALLHEAAHVASVLLTDEMGAIERDVWLGDDGHGPLWVALMDTLRASPAFRQSHRFYQREDVMRLLFPRRPCRVRCDRCYGVFPVTPHQAGGRLLCPYCPDQLLCPAAGIEPEGKPRPFRYPRITRELTI